MAITSSAKKAHRASLRKRIFNERRINAVRKLTKEIRRLVIGKKASEAKMSLSKAYKAIDKAVKMNTIHKNTGARKKSQLARLLQPTK
ncbi:MAG: 30S ribosomal protein S20 [candidate division CPR1 bacterium GW2011_GWA2_42_17]|uniref:Small ribosomal subunit protein bS20 n=1 Tax=candidate division CPR1 bacterium GW2011_GWA2_42_17 TaxID=1618341 RepID=A0A0G1BB97_9BACT|nr:MAG: 30S ribosomal protein S20 [candidate division CPR1 bacterium GW2011_GWA2_42_17]